MRMETGEHAIARTTGGRQQSRLQERRVSTGGLWWWCAAAAATLQVGSSSLAAGRMHVVDREGKGFSLVWEEVHSGAVNGWTDGQVDAVL